LIAQDRALKKDTIVKKFEFWHSKNKDKGKRDLVDPTRVSSGENEKGSGMVEMKEEDRLKN